MLRAILVTFFALLVLSFAVIWALGGGGTKIVSLANVPHNPIKDIMTSGSGSGSSTGYIFKLPGQPDMPALDVDATMAAQPNDPNLDRDVLNLQILNNDGTYSTKQNGGYSPKTYGLPSPYAGKVKILQGMATAQTAPDEYLEINASSGNTEPINISGWSVQSMVTGARYPFYYAANPPVAGTINTVHDIVLDPGATAYVVSGISPLSVSFRENVCMGYLGKMQHFSPQFSSSCPSPADDFAETPENLRRYGTSCLDFVRALPSCQFQSLSSLPNSITSACKTMIVNTFSYNGCVNMHRYDVGFERNAWRIYLTSPSAVWNDSHDIIRLIDASGRTVDAVTY